MYIFSDHSGSQGAKYVPELINHLYYLENVNKGEGLDTTLTIKEEDMFMFFSAGNAPIQLKNTIGGNDLIFMRPNLTECDGVACVCHCGAGPYWTYSKTSGFDFYLHLDEPYTCPEAFLTCQTANDEFSVFGNARGQEVFSDSVLEKTKNYKSKNDLFYSIPFDVVLLWQTTLSRDTDFSRYNSKNQPNDLVKELTENYEWEGGVVIGGTLNLDGKKKKLTPAHVILRTEKTSTDSVYGVCLDTDCFPEGSDITKLSSRQSLLSSVDIILSRVATQQKAIFDFITKSCLSVGTAHDSRVCQQKVSSISSFPLSDGTFNQYEFKQWGTDALYVLNFSLVKNNVWRITPQALITSSCKTPDFIEIISKPSFDVYLPLGFKDLSESEVPTTFLLVDTIASEENDPLSLYVPEVSYLTEKSLATLCSSLKDTLPTQEKIHSLGKVFSSSIIDNPNDATTKLLIFTLTPTSTT